MENLDFLNETSLNTLIDEASQLFQSCQNPDLLEQHKAIFFGKNGKITALMKNLGKLSVDEKKVAGAKINAVKKQIEDLLTAQRDLIKNQQLQKRLSAEALDISLPGRNENLGALHPVSQTLQRIENLFASLGFSVADGPEIEEDFYNFTALNTPENHPARSMHDTFYLLDDDSKVLQNYLLRTHTSPIQARFMQQHVGKIAEKNSQNLVEKMPEIRIIAPGRVYRVDSDATHSPMFHQVEGLWIGENISFADLKGVIADFLRKFFETDDLQVRFRPSFFPFTEPSAEIDVAFMSGALKGKWLEIAGCGMVHPNVLKMAGISPEHQRGFAFGFGPDRLTMLRYGINDLRLFFGDGSDLRFAKQFI